MTEQQIKRIREAVNTPNTAVYCADIQEREQLFDATGWDKDSRKYAWVLRNYPESCCFRRDDKDSNGWGYSREEWYKQGGFRVVKLHTLLTEPSTASKMLGIEDGRDFTFRDEAFRIDNGIVWRTDQYGQRAPQQVLWAMLNNPHEIHPVRVWGEETVKDARAAMRLGYMYVTKDKPPCIRATVWLSGPPHMEDMCWYSDYLSAKMATGRFPGLQPGECVALADIAGG